MPHQVLIVDDSTPLRVVLRGQLEALGYGVDEAVDGVDALTFLETGPSPDLMLLDRSMPRMGGVELLRRLRADQRWSQVPAILMSAYLTPDAVGRGHQAGADALLAKPFDRGELEALVASLLACERSA